jgi:hypothetical protein
MTTYTLADLPVSAIELLQFCAKRQELRLDARGQKWTVWQMPSFAMEQLVAAGLIEQIGKTPRYANYGPIEKWRVTQLGEAYLKMIG